MLIHASRVNHHMYYYLRLISSTCVCGIHCYTVLVFTNLYWLKLNDSNLSHFNISLVLQIEQKAEVPKIKSQATSKTFKKGSSISYRRMISQWTKNYLYIKKHYLWVIQHTTHSVTIYIECNKIVFQLQEIIIF